MKSFMMKSGDEVQVSDEDYARVMEHKWSLNVNGRSRIKYAHTFIDGRSIRLHRFITKATEGEIVDHKDFNGLNNQRSNLRLTDKTGNNRNRRMTEKAKASKYKGVVWSESVSRWRAQTSDKTTGVNRHISLGMYDDELTAAFQYDVAVSLRHGEFAATNKRQFGLTYDPKTIIMDSLMRVFNRDPDDWRVFDKYKYHSDPISGGE